MSTKVAVVTGSNKGIGLAIVRALCKDFPGDVYLTSRDEGRGLEAVGLLKNEKLDPKFFQLDINSEGSVQKLKTFMQSTYGGIDVLVNNAAIAFGQCCTPGGIGEVDPELLQPPIDGVWKYIPYQFPTEPEKTIRTNYFATKAFCHAIFPLLRPHSRVVHISSCCGFLKKINGKEPESLKLQERFADPKLTLEELDGLVNNFIEAAKAGTYFQKGWPSSSYDVSKVALTSLTRIQQRELDAARPLDNILVNSVHPGWVDTDMTDHKGPMTGDEGAVAATWLAMLEPDKKTPRGGYIWHDKTIVDWENGPLPSAY